MKSSDPFSVTSVTKEVDLKPVVTRLLEILKPGDWVAFEGDLGAGKTTFVRHLLREMGYPHPVTSPTYPLLVEYEIGDQKIIHIDGFRLDGISSDPWDHREWGAAIVLVEWPEKTQLPKSKFKFLIKIDFESERPDERPDERTDERTRRISLFSV